ALFFLVNYGLFHFAYLTFIASGLQFGTNKQSLPPFDFNFILLGGLIFFLNHIYSYYKNKPKDNEKQNLGKIFLFPFIRIIPMHLIIFLGAAFAQINYNIPLLLVFLILKTIADLIMHIVEHNFIARSDGIVPNETVTSQSTD
ncbi:MAG: DUF6498-containing protein, partial [bacterium]